MSDLPLDHLRAICLALPEAEERETWGEATFRVRDKIFAMAHATDDDTRMTCKAPPGAQRVLVEARPARFYVPAYVGHKGWIGVRLDGNTDWDEIAGFILESYTMTAPKRLAATLTPTSRSRPAPSS